MYPPPPPPPPLNVPQFLSFHNTMRPCSPPSTISHKIWRVWNVLFCRCCISSSCAFMGSIYNDTDCIVHNFLYFHILILTTLMCGVSLLLLHLSKMTKKMFRQWIYIYSSSMELGQPYAPLSVKQLWKIWLKWSSNKAQQRASRVLAQGIIVMISAKT